MLQYISDNSGHPTAVIIPIEEWNGIRNKYPDVEAIEGDLPQWQKDIIDKSLQAIADHPERLHPIEELFRELDNEED
ncbi:MAG TPA: hypothetical protein VK588_02265 [Chitinophagaceae bacterium]|nr:hypothetical protein [Chitinophagaceae bacterium]